MRTVRGVAAAAALAGLTLILSAAFNILGEHYRKVSAFPLLMDVTDCTQVEWLVAQWSEIDDAALEFVLRIHDRDHDFEVPDRFNRGLQSPPGQRTVVRVDLNDVREAPASRELDLRHVRGLVVYLHDGRNGPHGKIYVSRIGLE